MKSCPNHPDKSAVFVCYNCKKYYCEKCLTEVGENYYCSSPECKKFIISVLPKKILPEEVICPNCNSHLLLEENEREQLRVRCPECESLIDFNHDTPVIFNPKKYIQIFSSLNLAYIALIKSILEDAEIDYYLFGENFLIAEPLIQPARFFIRNDQVDEAKELLKDFNFNIFGYSTDNYEE